MSNMVINTNVLALNSHRSLKGVGTQQAKHSARLSSGLKINSAADDAAGLAISEKMRAQIKGLDMASKNSQDAISLIQSAEGGMQEIDNMIQRIRELTNQAANDTNEAEDREKIQEEITQLTNEIDSMSERVEFNKKKIINGDFASGKSEGAAAEVQGAFDSTMAKADATSGFWKNSTDFGSMKTAANGHASAAGIQAAFEELGNLVGTSTPESIFSDAGKTATFVEEAGKIVTAADSTISDDTTAKAAGFKDQAEYTNFKALYEEAKGLDEAFKNNPTSTAPTVTAPATTKSTPATIDTGLVDTAKNAATTLSANFANIKTASSTNVDANFKSAAGDIEALLTKHSNDYEAIFNNKEDALAFSAAIKTIDDAVTSNSADFTSNFSDYGFAAAGDAAKLTSLATAAKNVAEAYNNLPGEEDGGDTTETGTENGALHFQVGANAGQSMTLNVGSMKTKDLGIENFSILGLSGEEISAKLDDLDGALSKVTTERAKLGAAQNRLEYTIKSLDISSENLSAAESRIRDTDMAKEMMGMTKANVLQQAATSMLAQANQAPQNVLQLLG